MVCSFQSVLRLLVSPQVHFSLETFPAQVAAERFEASVFSAVRNEVRTLTEGLPAHLALVGLLTCNINNKQVSQLSFLRVTHGETFKRCIYQFLPLTCVNESVFFHV